MSVENRGRICLASVSRGALAHFCCALAMGLAGCASSPASSVYDDQGSYQQWPAVPSEDLRKLEGKWTIFETHWYADSRERPPIKKNEIQSARIEVKDDELTMRRVYERDGQSGWLKGEEVWVELHAKLYGRRLIGVASSGPNWIPIEQGKLSEDGKELEYRYLYDGGAGLYFDIVLRR